MLDIDRVLFLSFPLSGTHRLYRVCWVPEAAAPQGPGLFGPEGSGLG